MNSNFSCILVWQICSLPILLSWQMAIYVSNLLIQFNHFFNGVLMLFCFVRKTEKGFVSLFQIFCLKQASCWSNLFSIETALVIDLSTNRRQKRAHSRNCKARNTNPTEAVLCSIGISVNILLFKRCKMFQEILLTKRAWQ